MQETEAQLPEILASLDPALKAKRQNGAIMAGLVILTMVGTLYGLVTAYGTDDISLLLLPAVFGVIGVIGLNNWVIRKQQQLIMPHLAKAVHLEYQQNAKPFLNELPSRLLPRANVRKAEDCITGTIGGRHVTLAEVKVETGGRGSRTLFRGFVIRFQNAVMMPGFFVAPKRQTGGWFSRMKVDDLIEVDTIIGRGGEEFGVWLSELGAANRDPALKSVIAILTNLEAQVGVDARLFSATSIGEEMHIALTHNHDLFRIGGLLANQDQIAKNIKTAFEELNIPLRIVSVLLEAERQADRINRNGTA